MYLLWPVLERRGDQNNKGDQTMQMKIEIRKQTDSCEMRITAEPTTTDELKEVLNSCRGFTPRKKLLGIF